MTTAARALGIDGSEWFHAPALRRHLSSRHWRRLAGRAPIAIRAALQVCARLGAHATFFVPAELAVAADLLREIVAAGHEIALSAVADTPPDRVALAEREPLLLAWRRGKQRLEAAIGRRMHGFRAVSGSGQGAPWWTDGLRAMGFVYDATDRAGDAGPAARTVDGHCLPVAIFAAFRLDAGQPRLVGLPKAVFAAHYGQHVDAAAAATQLAGCGGTVAAALGLPLALAPDPPAKAAALPPPRRLPDNPRRLAIVVPLKDEEQGIESLVVELDAVRTRLADVAACEFVFVDDGSRDRTWELLQQHVGSRTDVRLVQHANNRGVAAAIQTGLRATDALVVASIDGDLSYDPMELRHMLPLLENAEVVTGSPYHERGGVQNVPGWRLLLSRTLSGCYRWLLRRPIRTWTSCFRLYRRSAVVDLPLLHPGFLGTAELLVRVLRRGGRVAEHPCVLEARLLGVSKLRVARTILGHLRLLWQVARRRIS